MACRICKNEKAGFTREGLDGNICYICSEALYNMQYKNNESSKKYLMSYLQSADSDVVKFLEECINGQHMNRPKPPKIEANKNATDDTIKNPSVEDIKKLEQHLVSLEEDVKYMRKIATFFFVITVISLLISFIFGIKIAGAMQDISDLFNGFTY